MRVLIISKTFPPDRRARALQIGKVAEAIATAGCEVKVVAGMPERAGQRSETTFGQVRVSYVPAETAPPRLGAKNVMARGWNRLRVECQRYRWIQQATKVAESLVRDFRPHVVLSSSTPVDSHWVGLYLKRRTGVGWVASFSDPWPFQLRPSPYDKAGTSICPAWDMHVIRRLLRWADGVHMPNRYAIDMVERGTGVPIREKAWAIPHIGGGSQECGQIDTSNWLAHIGELDSPRLCRPLLEAIQEVSAELNGKFGGLLCVGRVCPEFQDLARQMGLSDRVKCIGSVEAGEASRMASGSKALLVIEADMAISPFLPSKFADYACAGRPIIAITPPASAMRDYLQEHGGGWAVAHDRRQIARAIRETFGDTSSSIGVPGLGELFESTRVGRIYLEMFETLALCSLGAVDA